MSPAYYEALFGSDSFDFDDLQSVIKKSDPYVRKDFGSVYAPGAGYRSFADVSNAAGHANTLKSQFAKVKDKKAVAARLAALKKLGLSDREAVTAINDPKYLDYFEMEGVPQRYTTYAQPTATADSDGDTISDNRRDRKTEKKFQKALDFRRREQEQVNDMSLDYQAALRDEGLKRDYLAPPLSGGSRLGSRTIGGTTASVKAAQKKIDDDVNQANKQRHLAGNLPIRSLGEIPDAIGGSVSKRIFGVKDSVMRNEDKLSRIDQEFADIAAEADAAVQNGELTIDPKTKEYVAKRSRDGKPPDVALAKAYNDRLMRLDEEADELSALLDKDDKSLGAIKKEADKLGLVVGDDGEVYDPRTTRSYKQNHGDQFKEEDDYFAALPSAPASEDDRFRRAQLSVMTPAQRNGIQQRIRGMVQRPEDDEETYISRHNYFADQLVGQSPDGRLIRGPNPNAHLSARSQQDMHYNEINAVKEIRDKILNGEIEIPQELNEMGYDATQAAVELYKARKYARR